MFCSMVLDMKQPYFLSQRMHMQFMITVNRHPMQCVHAQIVSSSTSTAILPVCHSRRVSPLTFASG